MDNRFGCWDQAISYIAFFTPAHPNKGFIFLLLEVTTTHSCSNDQRYYSGQYLQKKKERKRANICEYLLQAIQI
jgi:hypothetical protein